MSKSKTGSNPFYAVILITGVLFAITAFAYFTMSVRDAGNPASTSQGFMFVMARYGLQLLIAEIVVLAIATFGAISTDEYWSRRASESQENTDQVKLPD